MSVKVSLRDLRVGRIRHNLIGNLEHMVSETIEKQILNKHLDDAIIERHFLEDLHEVLEFHQFQEELVSTLADVEEILFSCRPYRTGSNKALSN